MTLRRRAVLGALVSGASVALAGCLTDGSRDNDDKNDNFQRVNEPPHEISEPECPDAGEERDSLWLYANMPAEPSLAFEQQETTSAVLRDEGLETDFDESNSQFYAAFLTADADLDRVDRSLSTPATGLIEGTDFDSEGVLVSQTGWGSESAPRISNELRRPTGASTRTAITGDPARRPTISLSRLLLPDLSDCPDSTAPLLVSPSTHRRGSPSARPKVL